MKKVIAYIFLILVLFAFNYKSVNYLLNCSDSKIAYSVDCEEENTESEKSEKESEKKDFSEYLFHKSTKFFVLVPNGSFSRARDFLFLSSDFTKSLYMPPEHI